MGRVFKSRIAQYKIYLVLGGYVFFGILLPLVAALVFKSLAFISLVFASISSILFVSFLFVSYKKISMLLLDAQSSVGLSSRDSDIVTDLEEFLVETKRFNRAAYLYRLGGDVHGSDLGVNLQRIARLAYDELQAEAVELALWDEESEQWAQSIVLGAPRSSNSQSMLLDASSISRTKAFDVELSEDNVLIQPVAFAGKLFGCLRIELEKNYVLSQADLEVSHLLATQGAMMLIDGRFTDELLRMRRASEESVKAKTGFLANLSHEIRGPLGTVINGVEMTLDGLCGPISDLQKETLLMVRGSAEHLLDLVNDVLDYAKVESGKLQTSPIEVSLRPLLEDMSKIIRVDASNKNQKVILNKVDEDLGAICDKRHLRQILINFLTNAVKYTPEGGTIEIFATKEANNKVKILVKDNGIGIKEDQKDKVFQAFERVDDDYAQKQMGTGLGIPFAKKLAEINGGRLEFESEYGHGSAFWLILDRVQIKNVASQVNISAENKQIKYGNGEVVLVVEHEEETLHLLGRYLQHQNFRVLAARNINELFKVLQTTKVDLAIVDNEIPGVQGEELIQSVRSNPKGARLPIILISSKAFAFDVERFIKLGVDRCLSKPLSLEEVSKSIRILIDETKHL